MRRINKISLSAKQKEAFDWIKAHVRRTGEWPSFRELRDGLGYKSVNSATQLMSSLKEKGWIEKRGSYYDFIKEDQTLLTPQRLHSLEQRILAALVDAGLSSEEAGHIAASVLADELGAAKV